MEIYLRHPEMNLPCMEIYLPLSEIFPERPEMTLPDPPIRSPSALALYGAAWRRRARANVARSRASAIRA